MIKNYSIPFINSTLVISAWENERLIGAVRVLSDKMFRSIIYDLLVLPEYQNKGIGKELLQRCIEGKSECHGASAQFIYCLFSLVFSCCMTFLSIRSNRISTCPSSRSAGTSIYCHAAFSIFNTFLIFADANGKKGPSR